MSVDMHSVHQLIRYSSEYKADFDEGLRTQAHTHTSHSLSFNCFLFLSIVLLSVLPDYLLVMYSWISAVYLMGKIALTQMGNQLVKLL